MHGAVESEEIQAVLSSRAFLRAPNLARLLKYLCDSYFSESKDNLNEYRIGVEALGRSADFDPATNPSVRVEIHRLREKLRTYYETEGIGHPCRIELEDGRYALRFVRPDGSEDAASGGQPVSKEPSQPLPRVPMANAAQACGARIRELGH